MGKKILPPNYFCVLLILLILMHFIVQSHWLFKSPYRFIGVFLILFGILINLWTDRLFKKLNTTVKPHQTPTAFITSGPFKISRHPMYLGMVSILLGLSVVCGTVLTLIFPLVFIVLMEILFIGVEENNMKKQFGDKYIQYKRKTRRWI